MHLFRRHLTYANVMSTLAVFLVIGGGTALASYVVSSNSQVGPDTISGHKPRTGDHANIIGGTVNGTDIATAGVVSRNVADNSLTGTDVNESTLGKVPNADTLDGVDSSALLDGCPTPLLAKFGRICAGSDGGSRTWYAALSYCSGLGLRLPSPSEAYTLGDNYTVPGVTGTQNFWTDDFFISPNGNRATTVYNASGGQTFTSIDDPSSNAKTVCVANPTNN